MIEDHVVDAGNAHPCRRKRERYPLGEGVTGAAGDPALSR